MLRMKGESNQKRTPSEADSGCSQSSPVQWAYGVVVSMFDFHCSDRGSNPGRGGKIS